jgi:hypothetical protein
MVVVDVMVLMVMVMLMLMMMMMIVRSRDHVPACMKFPPHRPVLDALQPSV